MTADELHAAAARLVAQRVEQGFGERVDRATLARIGMLIGELTPETRNAAARGAAAALSGGSSSASTSG